ncbi:MAG: type II toxin-antitoxin system RelE/ParE family toxin [Desulfobacteraceae bacterium]|nr:type II toxin-antitoxin system RelE/ParE family toxin [Desulfobacteraceae bacterium]
MAWKVEFEKEAQKELKKIDPQQAKRIIKYLFERIVGNEDPYRFGEALKYDLSGLRKYRIGDYRVICHIESEKMIVLVVRIGRRKGIYHNK